MFLKEFQIFHISVLLREEITILFTFQRCANVKEWEEVAVANKAAMYLTQQINIVDLFDVTINLSHRSRTTVFTFYSSYLLYCCSYSVVLINREHLKFYWRTAGINNHGQDKIPVKNKRRHHHFSVTYNDRLLLACLCDDHTTDN